MKLCTLFVGRSLVSSREMVRLTRITMIVGRQCWRSDKGHGDMDFALKKERKKED
jgi:hypothetical protein